jgi:transcriptional regulator with XRE-family HTH domain
MSPLELQLRELRESAGLSQVALADAVGVSQRAISELENGVTRRVDLDLLERLADVLGVTPAEVIGASAKRAKKR